MNIKKGLPGSIALLALLISTGSQATTERPQLKNYSSYNDFMRAVVDYAKNDGAPSSDMRECDDPEVGPDGKPTDKLNPCLPKQPTGNEPAADATSAASGQDTAASEPDDLDSLDNLDGSSASSGQDAPADAEVTDPDIRNTPSGDTLEQALALTRDGLNPAYVDPDSTRTTFRSFPMQPVGADDLASVTFVDALSGLLANTRDSKIRLNINTSTMTYPLAQADDRVAADGLSLNLDNFAYQRLLFDNVAPFFGGDFVWTTEGNYYAIVNANPYFIDNNGVALDFSTQARIRAAVVDSDGWISAANPNMPTAGAFVIDPLNITTGTISAKLWAIQDATGNTSVRSLLESRDDITVDLSNSMIGVASASRNATSWDIGPVSTIMAFGDNSVLSLRLNGPLETILSNPDEATNTPLIRINGTIARMSLGEVSLLDGSSGHGIHYGRITVNNLEIVNQSIYFEDGTIRVDMGKGANNLHVAMERVVVGGSLQDRANGTLPHVIYDREMYITTPDNAQITLRAH